MLSLRTHIIICISLLATLIGVAILGNILQKFGMGPLTGTGRYIGIALFFGLFIAFGLSAVPVIVKSVLAAQVRLGNESAGAVAAAIRHQNTIIWSMWGLMLAGLAIGVPAAIAGGMFGDEPARMLNAAGRKNLGALVARPDMTLDELVAWSTIKLDLTYARSAIAGGQNGAFDFTIPGTTITFPGARYYYMTTYSHDSTRIQAVNIGVSPEKMTRAEVDSADLALRARLAADGWLTGHEVYRTEEDRALHGGATEGPEGHHWLKDGIVLDISRKRMDDERPGEDTATAGEWIQYIDLWGAKGYSGIDRLVFQKPR